MNIRPIAKVVLSVALFVVSALSFFGLLFLLKGFVRLEVVMALCFGTMILAIILKNLSFKKWVKDNNRNAEK